MNKKDYKLLRVHLGGAMLSDYSLDNGTSLKGKESSVEIQYDKLCEFLEIMKGEIKIGNYEVFENRFDKISSALEKIITLKPENKKEILKKMSGILIEVQIENPKSKLFHQLLKKYKSLCS